MQTLNITESNITQYIYSRIIGVLCSAPNKYPENNITTLIQSNVS